VLRSEDELRDSYSSVTKKGGLNFGIWTQESTFERSCDKAASIAQVSLSLQGE